MPSPEFGGPDIAMLTGTRSTSEICAERRRRITDEGSRKSELANASVNVKRTVMTLSSTAPLELEYEVVPITLPAHGRDASSTQQGMQLRNQLRCSETGPHMRDELLGICVVVLLLDAYALSFDRVSDALTPKRQLFRKTKTPTNTVNNQCMLLLAFFLGLSDAFAYDVPMCLFLLFADDAPMSFFDAFPNDPMR